MDTEDDVPNLDGDFFDEAITDFENRQKLERLGAKAAEIQIDLSDKGPLYHYFQSRRSHASDALRQLVNADPRDGVSIALLQAGVREYLSVCDHIVASLRDAQLAAELINQEYGPNEHDEPEEHERRRKGSRTRRNARRR